MLGVPPAQHSLGFAPTPAAVRVGWSVSRRLRPTRGRLAHANAFAAQLSGESVLEPSGGWRLAQSPIPSACAQLAVSLI